MTSNEKSWPSRRDTLIGGLASGAFAIAGPAFGQAAKGLATGNIDLGEQERAFQSFVDTWGPVSTEQFMGAFVWEWRPGAKTLAQAKKNCRLAPLTRGGIVAVTQWKKPITNSDLSCR